MDFRSFLADNLVILDGGMGTLLQQRGLAPGELPERWNLSHPREIVSVHKAYFDAGSNVVCTNTFGANSLKFSYAELEEIIAAAVRNAKKARNECEKSHEKFIALDIGPSGKLLKPLGDLDFEDAVGIFAEVVRIGAACGVDLVVVETMNDSYETKAALLAVKENCSLPVIVTNAYGADGKLMTGADPAAMVALLEGMCVDALGANCSLGPQQLKGVAEQLLANASVPVVMKPNAGIPQNIDGITVFDVDEAAFAQTLSELVDNGVRVAGGCCGTTPAYISALCSVCASKQPKRISDKNRTVVSSFTHAVSFADAPILIGERINPTGKKRFKQALLEHDMNYILDEGVRQQECGVHILDVNVGLPDIDEKKMLCDAVQALQQVSDLPLQIDTADMDAMEAALRCYNGKPMINSVNGKAESMHAVFPLVKKYGGVVVALTLDEKGIPDTAEGRIKIAERILNTAAMYGIEKKDIVFDTLAMTVSADANAANVTLEALAQIRDDFGCHTSLGVSNVSFGLPNRDAINSSFFLLALSKGLSAAIMNPYSAEMLKVYYTYNAIRGFDANCSNYISVADQFVTGTKQTVSKTDSQASDSELQACIIKGFRERAGVVTRQLLETVNPLDIVNHEIIPALNTVGEGFEKKTVYLPQLLMSAEAAKCAFGEIKQSAANESQHNSKGVFVLATVEGDIHDIGKNIVRLLMENYGYSVFDLGRDVPAEKIVETVQQTHAPLVGLSALMTTTVPAMEKTIKLLREKAPWTKIVVGGAVLTKEYAALIGADHYAADALETVHYADDVTSAV